MKSCFCCLYGSSYEDYSVKKYSFRIISKNLDSTSPRKYFIGNFDIVAFIGNLDIIAFYVNRHAILTEFLSCWLYYLLPIMETIYGEA